MRWYQKVFPWHSKERRSIAQVLWARWQGVAIIATFSMLSLAQAAPDLSPVDRLFAPEATPSKPPLTREDYQRQLTQLDQEILLLKAELAQKNGQVTLVEHLLASLKPENLPASDQARYQALTLYVQRKRQSADEEVVASAVFQVDFSHPVVLLPLTGEYGDIGQAIWEGMQAEGLTAKVIDTAIFDSPEALWQVLQYMPSSLIIGPLRPQWSQALAQFNQHIPMFTLSDAKTHSSLVRTLAPQRSVRLAILKRFLQTLPAQRVLLLKDKALNRPADLTVTVPFLTKGVSKGISQEPPLKVVSEQTVQRSMDLAVEQGLNTRRSLARIHWLRRTLHRPLVSEVRARQDIQSMVLIGQAEQAIQGRPLLSYYHLNRVPFVWLADRLPSVRDIRQRLSLWQQTYVILPAFFPLAALKAGDEGQKNSPDDQVGIFYALGQSAIQILHWLASEPIGQNQPPRIKRFPIGKVVRWGGDNIGLLPHLIWLDEGTVDELPMEEVLLGGKDKV